MALVKLPASALTALVGERGKGIACGLGPPTSLIFFLIQFGIRKLWILANGLVSFISLTPDLLPPYLPLVHGLSPPSTTCTG